MRTVLEGQSKKSDNNKKRGVLKGTHFKNRGKKIIREIMRHQLRQFPSSDGQTEGYHSRLQRPRTEERPAPREHRSGHTGPPRSG